MHRSIYWSVKYVVCPWHLLTQIFLPKLVLITVHTPFQLKQFITHDIGQLHCFSVTLHLYSPLGNTFTFFSKLDPPVLWTYLPIRTSSSFIAFSIQSLAHESSERFTYIHFLENNFSKPGACPPASLQQAVGMCLVKRSYLVSIGPMVNSISMWLVPVYNRITWLT